MLCHILSSFYNFKISTPNKLVSLFERDDFNLKEKSSSKKWVSKAFIGFLSHKSNYEGYKKSLKLNKTLNLSLKTLVDITQ